MYVTILKALRKSAVNTFVYVYLTQHFSTLLVNGAGFFPHRTPIIIMDPDLRKHVL